MAVLIRTSDVPSAYRYDAWRSIVCDTLGPLDMRNDPDVPLSGEIEAGHLGPVNIGRVQTSTPHSMHRTPGLIRRGSAELYRLVLAMSGNPRLEQDGRTARLRPGEFAIYDFARPYELSYDSAVQLAVFGFPRDLLALPPDSVGRLTAVPIAADTGTDSLWRTHCEPTWASWPMNAVTAWKRKSGSTRCARQGARHAGRNVTGDDRDVPPLSAETILAAVHLMSGLYTAAMNESPPLVLSNPFARLELPKIEPQAVEFLEHGEAEALYDAAGMMDAKWRTMIELGIQVGLRFEELAGLHGHRVDWLRGRVEVIDVVTRKGLRQYPKSRKSHRIVPVPPPTLEGMSRLMAGRPRDALVFTSPNGGPVDDGNFRDRVWYLAVAAARLCGMAPPAVGDEFREAECGLRFCSKPEHKIRRFPPRVMRNTAASWLVQDGVPLYDVQALLGHESFATTQWYAHLRPPPRRPGRARERAGLHPSPPRSTRIGLRVITRYRWCWRGGCSGRG